MLSVSPFIVLASILASPPPVDVVPVSPAESRRQAEADLAKFQGIWKRVGSQVDGRRPSDGAAGGDYTATYRGDLLTLDVEGKHYLTAIVTLDPGQSPKAINTWNLDGASKGETYPGIYEIDGDTMKVCFARPGKKRPAEFGAGTPENGLIFYEYRRVKP